MSVGFVTNSLKIKLTVIRDLVPRFVDLWAFSHIWRTSSYGIIKFYRLVFDCLSRRCYSSFRLVHDCNPSNGGTYNMLRNAERVSKLTLV
jgi:hypothetical protein